MIKMILVDDELPVLDLLDLALSAIPEVEVVGRYQRPANAVEELPALLPDAAFLDMELPGMNGIELASRLSELHPGLEVVFVTAHDQYAIDAFRVNALDYVLKPVTLEKLQESVNRVKRRMGDRANPREMKASGGGGSDGCGAGTRGYAGRGADGRPSYAVRMLGGFEVRRRNGTPIRWMTSKVEELLAFLLLRDGSVSKWVIIDALWPDAEPRKAEQNFYTTIYRLKRTLQEEGICIRIEVDKGMYRLLDQDNCLELDARRLLAAFRGEEMDPESRRQACLGYQGELLEGKDYLWTYSLKQKYYDAFRNLAFTLAQEAFGRGERKLAAKILERVLEEDPEDEEAARLVQ